ncbi:hypothetical protein E4U41_002377 [Claviceps citrina]|nr:hypothetical protein E4U41_002377 [Claviceps citrina]
MAPVGIALIGGGIFVKNEHLEILPVFRGRADTGIRQPAVLKCEQLSLKAIFSRSLKSAEETADLVPGDATVDLYSNDSGAGKTYHDLLLRDDVAAVIVALPIMAQTEYIEAALAAGKHVLAEKPLAPDVETAQRLIAYAADAACRNGATLCIAENYRFREELVFAYEQARKLGKLKQFSLVGLMSISKDSVYHKTYWRAKPSFQGGFVLDGGIHFAAGARLFLRGESAPATLHAFTSQISEHLVPFDTAHAIVRLQSGASASFHISMGSAFGRVAEYRIEYEGGTIHISGTQVAVRGVAGTEDVVREFTWTSGVASEVATWAAGLIAGEPDPRQSADLALGDLEFMEAVFKSAAQNGQGQVLTLQ